MNTKAIAGLALLVVGLCLLPLLGVVAAAVFGSTETFAMLADTVLWRYSWTTLALMSCVAGGSVVIGVSTAWLVVSHEFRGRAIFEVALVIPLAFPAYVLAYAYTHILDHPGVVQSGLRALMGWGPRDYWFPEIRSLGGAVAMLTLVLYPYVYLLARAAFKLQSTAAFRAARSLGSTPARAFWGVSLPMARPAIAAGVLLVVMETIADFGTVAHFGVQTFATGIYTSWFSLADRGAAAQLALGLLAFALLLATLEQHNRGAARYAIKGQLDGTARQRLTGARALGAQAVCLLPITLGVAVPTVALIFMGLNSEQDIFGSRYLGFVQNSVTLATIAAVVTVAAAVFLGSFKRFAPGGLSAAGVYIARLGYAVPGGVIAVGLLVPFAGFDNWLDGRMEAVFGISTGLLITSSIWLLIFAYMIRFLAAAIGAYDSGLAAVSGNIDAASAVLGKSPGQTMRRVHLAILRPSLITALLIVFVDAVKELPATLILRPFNYDTLAVQAFRLASDERLEGAAVPSLMIAAIGLVPVILLCWQMRAGRSV